MADENDQSTDDTGADDDTAQAALAAADARNGQSGSGGTQSGQSSSQSGSQSTSDGADDDGSGDQSSDEPDWKAEAERWKGHARKHEQRAKDNADAAKKLKDIEDKDKSETEKLSEQNADLHRQVLEYQVGEVRRNAASAAGLPADMAQFITAVEAEDAAGQARLLAEKLRPAQGQQPPADFAQGTRQQASPPQTPDAWLRDWLTSNR